MFTFARFRTAWFVAAIGWLNCAPWALAAETPATGQPATTLEFPDNWVGEPLRLQSLRGKAVVLYFYEEGCPKCKGSWPSILAKTKQYEGQPVLFVAVNSGNPRSAVEQYARRESIPWPIVVDTDRSFERACDVEISLNNIMQLRYISPAGELKMGNWADWSDTIDRALTGAQWRVEPADIPLELRDAWWNIEISQFPASAAAVTRGLGSRKREVKSASEKLLAAVERLADVELSAARQVESGDKLGAYLKFGEVADRFHGYPAAHQAAQSVRELARDADLKKDLSALKVLDKQRTLLASPKPAVRQRAVATLQKLLEDHPDGELARQARALLAGQ